MKRARLDSRLVQRARRIVFITAANQRELSCFQSLSRTFAGDNAVHVILDRHGNEPAKSSGRHLWNGVRTTDEGVSRYGRASSGAAYGLVAVIAARPARRP